MKHDVHVQEVAPQSYAALVLLNKFYTMLERRQWAKFRKKVLTKELAKKGYLECGYCHRRDLTMDGDKRTIATLDHIVPRSAGGAETDEDNVVICCSTCNHKKSSQSQEDFLTSDYLQRKITAQKKE